MVHLGMWPDRLGSACHLARLGPGEGLNLPTRLQDLEVLERAGPDRAAPWCRLEAVPLQDAADWLE